MQSDAVAIGIRNDNHPARGEFMRSHHNGKVLFFDRGQSLVEIRHLQRRRGAFRRGFAQKDPVLNVGMVQRLNRAQTVSHTIVGQLK
jgi:hypothetical protein